MSFLYTQRDELIKDGLNYVDFVCVTGDAYVDHPSFGIAVISRYLESLGYKVGIIAMPKLDKASFEIFKKPRYGFLVTSGNIDCMVSNYTVAKNKRKEDLYIPKDLEYKRPDRAIDVYSKLIRQAYPDTTIIIGGLEASLRRFSHYDYWSDTVMQSILCSSKADILVYGMGELAIKEIAQALKKKSPLKNILGTCVLSEDLPDEYILCPSHKEVCEDKDKYNQAVKIQYENQDHIYGKTLVQKYNESYLIQYPPQRPLTTKEFDEISELPYERAYHPMYEKYGGIKAVSEVEFSIIRNRGCFGACNFCSLAFHQGRSVTTRSNESVIREAILLSKKPNFKGYIHDVGGPTANFTGPSCDIQKKNGVCKNKKCLAPTPCKNLKVDHEEFRKLLSELRKIDGVKKVFIRSGIRFDYLMLDKDDRFFSDLVNYHISGQLKVAPEHISDNVLMCMGKPDFDAYKRFYDKYKSINKKLNKKQYLVPYLMSGHPQSTLKDALKLAEYIKEMGYDPKQVQDFYPTPGTISTAMYYTGKNPITNKKVYIPTDEEKAMQRALLQFRNPKNKPLVQKAMNKARPANKKSGSSHIKLNLKGSKRKK